MFMIKELFITGAGVSASSGIPTFRGSDGFWTIGSVNYTPQEMATRQMYENDPIQFLLWYYKRFARYKDAKPNNVHEWLSNKYLITQNIDGLDYKAGNENYIPIHGRLDKLLVYDNEMKFQEPIFAFVPSIGISEIIKIENNFSKYWFNNFLVASLNSSHIYRFKWFFTKTFCFAF